MKVSAALVLLAFGLVSADPEPPASSSGGPYPPSGWKPSGRLLILPARQEVAQVYGAPPQEYGSPQPAHSTEPEAETTDYPSTTPQSDESSSLPNNGFISQQLQQQPGVNSGVYHVLLPDGRLQRVEYTTAPLKSDAAQSFSSPVQQSSNQFQQQEQNNFQQYQQNGNYQQPQFQQFAFPSSFPQPGYDQPQSQNSNYQQQGQFGQSGFQKPDFQQNQFGLNTFEQNQYQQNQFGQSGNFQAPQSGKFQNTFRQDRFSAGSFSQQQKQYPQGPASQKQTDTSNYTPDSSQNQFNQKKYNKTPGQQSQSKEVSTNVRTETSSKYTNAQPQPQPQVFAYQQIYLAQEQEQQQQQQQQQQQPEQADGEPAPPAFTGYVANVQYKDVEPIPSPIYSYNPAPLVRILRKTE